MTAWSAITRLGPVLKGMDDLATYEDENGKVLYDVPDGELADEDVPAPVRLLGAYDNVWLSHAARDRVTDPEARTAWMAENGASAYSLFADGWIVGLWKQEDGRVTVLQTLRTLTKRERSELDEEIARVEALLARWTASQRGVRDSSAARAATPAVEVRSTSSPRRTTTAPASVKAATSSSVSPPSGPTTTTTRPDAGTSISASDADASSCRTTARSASAHERDDVVGRRQRRDVGQPGPARLLGGLAGGGPPAGQRLVGALALPDRDRAGGCPRHDLGGADLGEHLDGELAAVALGQRLDDDERGRRLGGVRSTEDTVTENTRLPVEATAPTTDVPAPSVRTTCSPTRSRRTATAWCASSPVTSTASPTPTPDSDGTRWTGRDISAGLKRVAQPAEDGLGARLELPGRLLLAADRGELGEELLLARVEPGRRLDGDGHDQVAAAAAQPGHPAAPQDRLGAGLRARLDVQVEGRLEVGGRTLCRFLGGTTSASRVGSSSVVPSAAAVIGTVTVQCRSLPCRTNVGCRATVIST